MGGWDALSMREGAYMVPEENACVLVPSVAHTPPLLVVEGR